MIAAFILHQRESFKIRWKVPFVPILIVIAMLFLVRLYPNYSGFGFEKTGKFLLLGIPAFYFGFYTMWNRQLYSTFLSLLWVSSIFFTPFLLYMTLYTPVGETQFHWIGNSGYQMTGVILMLGCFAAVKQKRPFVVGTLLFAVTLTGSVSSFSVGALSMITLYIRQRECRRTLARGLVVVLTLTSVYTSLSSIPYSIGRAYLKSRGLISQISQNLSSGRNEIGPVGNEIGPVGNEIGPVGNEIGPVGNVINSEGSRLDLFLGGLSVFSDNVWIGAGTGNFKDGVYNYPHNLIIEFASEFGLFGLLIVLFLILRIFRALIRTTDPFVWCLTVASLSISMFSGFFGERIFLFALGILSANTFFRSKNEATT
jgi:O-antigen ligase